MMPVTDNPFDMTTQTGPTLALELISAHARLAGSVNLGAYTRLSDLLSFHDEILAVTDGRVLTAAGSETGDKATQLDVHLDTLTLVIDRSDYVPPPDADQAIEKKAHRMLAVTEGHIITGTFFTYPDAEPIPYLRAVVPKWVPIANVEVRSLVDPSAKVASDFAVLRRAAVIATAII